MSSTTSTCLACKTPLTFGAIEGFCPRCIAAALLAGKASYPVHETEVARELRPGRFAGFELIEELGRGGMGVVYRARQIRLPRDVAVKVLLQGPVADQRSVRRFQAEAAAVARLRHPNIVAIHEVGEFEGRHFYSMDLVEGRNLAQVLRSGDTLPASRIARIIEQIARAAHHAHERGVLHRDLKPSNVLLDTADEPHVTDFGLAKQLFSDSELTVTGQVLGSPNYIPPEQADARHELVSVRSDVYSVGAILYHMLVGKPPFGGDSVAATLQQVLTREPTAPRSLKASVPADLETICLRCLEKDPARRYAGAAELADELGRFLRDEPIRARPAGPLERAWRWCRRRPIIAGLTAVTCLLTAGIAALSHVATVRGLRNREATEASRYTTDMLAAQQAWSQNNFRRARELLQAHQPKPGEQDRRGFEWYLLREWCKNQRHITLLSQTNAFLALAIDEAGNHVAVVDNKHLQIVSLADAQRIQNWELPSANDERTVLFLPGNDFVLTTENGGVLLHEVATGRRLWQNMNRGESLYSFLDGAAVAVFDEPLFRSNRPPATPRRVLPLRKAAEQAGPRLAGIRHPVWTYLLDAPSAGSGREEVPGNPENADSATGRRKPVELTLHDGTVVRAQWGGALDLREAKTGRILWTVAGLPRQPVKLAVSRSDPPHAIIAHTGIDQIIHLRDLADGHELLRLQGHTGAVTGLAFHPDNTSLLSCGRDGSLILWETIDLRQRPRETILEIAPANYGTVAQIPRPLWSPDGRFFTLALLNNYPPAFGVYQRANYFKLITLPGKPMGFSPDGGQLLVDLGIDGFRVVDVSGWTNRLGFRLPRRPGMANAQLSPDQRYLAVTEGDDRLVVIDATSGIRIATNRIVTWQCNFTPDSRSLVINSTNEVSVWDFQADTRRTLLAERGEVVATSPDGRTVAIGTTIHEIKLVDLVSGRLRASLTGHHGAVLALSYAPDGRTLASAGEDRTIRFWNMATFREAAVVPLESPVRLLQFDLSGDTLSAANGTEYFLWSTSRDPLFSPAYSPTNSTLGDTIWRNVEQLARRFPL